MNVAEPTKNFSKSEINSVVRMIEICADTRSRLNVSLPNTSSHTSIYAQGHGFIDKAECISENGVEIETLMSRCDALGFDYEGRRLTDKKLYFVVSSGGHMVHFVWGHEDNQILRKFFFNPSHYRSVDQTIDFLKIILEEEVFNSSRILRMDFTVDLPVPFEEVLGGITIKHKIANSEFALNSKRSGLKLGLNDDQIKVYDKAAKEKIDHPLTRIERQLKGKYLPFRKLSEFPNSLTKILELEPFETTVANHIHFFDGECKTEEQMERFQKLKTLVEFEGFQLARKKLSKNGNFNRDYGKFFMLTPYKKQPKEYFEKDMKKYFKEEKSESN